MTEAVTAHEIVVRRVFDAPREAVWDAWTQPDQLAAWWGPGTGARLPRTSRSTSGPAGPCA